MRSLLTGMFQDEHATADSIVDHLTSPESIKSIAEVYLTWTPRSKIQATVSGIDVTPGSSDITVSVHYAPLEEVTGKGKGTEVKVRTTQGEKGERPTSVILRP